MTRNELADFLGYHRTFVHALFEKSDCPTIKKKSTSSTINRIVDYTIDEAVEVMSQIPSFTPMLETYLRENYTHEECGYKDTRKKKVKLPKNIQDFIYYYGMSKCHYAACVTCTYMVARKIDKLGCGYRPYCNLYSTFLYNRKPKIDVYKDRCPSFRFSDLSPFIFLPGNMPQRLNVFREQNNTTLGIDNSLFKSKREGDEPIVVLHSDFYVD